MAASVPVAWIRRLLDFGRFWMVHIWLGLPLLCALTGYLSTPPRYTDVYPTALREPAFWRQGTIDRPDLRGRDLRLIMTNGEQHEIRCSMGTRAGSSCLFGHEFPISAKVELFSYRGNWMILTVYDLGKDRTIVKKDAQIDRYRSGDKYSSTITPESEMYRGLTIGILIMPLFIAGALLIRLKRYLNKRREALHVEP